MDFESIASLTQKYIASRPVVVLGSGSSIPYGLPSMACLAEGVLRKVDVRDDPSWNTFKENLQITIDLEETLQKFTLSEALLGRVVTETWNITAKKDIGVYQDLIENKTRLVLTRLFQHLLRTANPQFTVITTNYDRLAEYAANMAKAEVLTGFTSGWIQRFVPDNSTNVWKRLGQDFEGRIYILKVHGSLDWFEQKGREAIAIPLAREIPESFRPLMVTPGISKYQEVHKDPFRTIMSQSDAVLKKASCFLCIGFGFNDEHLQPILLDRVRNNDIPIVIVTKKLTPAAQTAFLKTPPPKYIIFEEDEKGTTVYSQDCPNGEVVPDYELWNLSSFVNMLLGEEVTAS